MFFKHGYAGTTMEKVAARAGFSKRTVYLYFKNKDELFTTVAEKGLVILRERLEEIKVSQLPVQESISAVLDTYLWFAKKHPNYFRIIFQEATPEMIANTSEELRLKIKQHERACLKVVVDSVKKAIDQGLISDVDPGEIAGIFWGAVTGIIILSMGGSQTVFSRKTRETMAAKAVWILFEGMISTAGTNRYATYNENSKLVRA